MNVFCNYCHLPAALVTGETIYPHRQDLSDHKFWLCAWCDAYVGVHEGTDTPLGTLANRTLRELRGRVHAAFDPLWRTGKMRRRAAYEWLAEGLGIPAPKCHIALFDEEGCKKALGLLGRTFSNEGHI